MHTDRDQVRRHTLIQGIPILTVPFNSLPLLLSSKPLPPQLIGPVLIQQHSRMLPGNRIPTQIVGNDRDTPFSKMGSTTLSRHTTQIQRKHTQRDGMVTRRHIIAGRNGVGRNAAEHI